MPKLNPPKCMPEKMTLAQYRLASPKDRLEICLWGSELCKFEGDYMDLYVEMDRYCRSDVPIHFLPEEIVKLIGAAVVYLKTRKQRVLSNRRRRLKERKKR